MRLIMIGTTGYCNKKHDNALLNSIYDSSDYCKLQQRVITIYDRCEDRIDPCSYLHSLISCEIKGWKIIPAWTELESIFSRL